MTFEVEIDGRLRSVSIEAIGAAGPRGGRFRVVIGDAADAVGPGVAPAAPEILEVDASATDLGLSLVFAADGRGIDVAVTERAAGDWLLQLPHVSLSALVDRRRQARGRVDRVAGAGEQRVMAPMPGRVVRVLVKPGEDVALRQGLVVVEAMKMENELTSPKAGRVKEVAVIEGASVEAGRLLVVVE